MRDVGSESNEGEERRRETEGGNKNWQCLNNIESLPAQ